MYKSPREWPTHIIKGIITMQTLEFIPTCIVTGHCSYDILRHMNSLPKRKVQCDGTPTAGVYPRLLQFSARLQSIYIIHIYFSFLESAVFLSCIWKVRFNVPIKVAARSKAWTVFARSNTGIVCSNPTRDMDVCVRLFCFCCPVCR
jgi:hypothetical protein